VVWQGQTGDRPPYADFERFRPANAPYNEMSMNNVNNRNVRAFLFDLDGTLIDSKRDLVNSVNAMLREIHRPEQPTELVASYVGHGAPQLIASVLGPAADEHERTQALAIFLVHYQQQKLKHTRPYVGVVEGLRTLAGYPMVVLSNKPSQMSIEIVQGLDLATYFRGVYGGDSFNKKKPDPGGALAILKQLGVSPAESAMVGDSDVDIQTARNAGMLAVGVTYGFGQHNPQLYPADLYVDNLAELLPLAASHERMQ
jgi:phosphoglycolate phosphatase